jgi:isopenicillin N synthase-like dioxygenase
MSLLEVPIVDIGPYFEDGEDGKQRVARLVNQACEDIGFFVITGHGVDSRVPDRVFDTSGRFFDLPLEEKLQVKQWGDDIPRGFSPIAAEAVSYSRLKKTPGDLKESFSVGPLEVPADEYYHRPPARQLLAENRWPAHPAEFQSNFSDYFRAMERLGASVMRIFAAALELPENFFDRSIDRHTSVLRVINYPDQPEAPLEGQLRAGEHSDYGTFTILRHEHENRPGGLQVLNRAGRWIDVPALPDSFIVNIGDLMARWTNDRYVSTVHRVVNPPRERALSSRRMSIVFFHQTNYDSIIECIPSCCGADRPPLYPAVPFHEYLRTKFLRQVTFDRPAEAP